ncbi:glycoside hydrolase family 18 protein [Dyadobacter sediminis]|uniref:chitinase n=1 Tax=Dyadobacter sediminis TaxID=1493691 RepID=A0A5R9KFR5_9BACT|nr:glycoside hydrolase family 18 protein [Dyadobacter sediminis]TLU94973.1 glycoside hydrolase family 18 protein [Dyadobacter sediminis]GGB86404.1 chitinase [Dyadobacter sediminis]
MKSFLRLLLLTTAFCCFHFHKTLAQKKKKYVVNAYVGGFRGLVNTEEINADKLTHINYAFVNVQDSLAVLTNLATDSTNFRKLNALKLKNPDLQILISIGGWAWSENFSDAVLTPTSRLLFAKSSVDIIRQYHLDGVDIDWEYPAMRGEEGNVFRPEDKQNFTLMFKALREELNILEKEKGRKFLLTAAVGGSKSFIDNTEMGLLQPYMDYIFIMTYDYGGKNGTVGHHTNLYGYGNSRDVSSADQSVKNFIAAGVPASKIGLGAAFYGKGWEAETGKNNGLGEKRIRSVPGGGYTKLKDSLINQNGYKKYYDKKARAPYLFNDSTKVLITYEDEKSVRDKCKYVKKHKLAGIFFWEYFNDPKEYLIKEISRNLD